MEIYKLINIYRAIRCNIEAKKTAINEFEWAEEAGYTLDNPDFQVLYMRNVESKIYDEDGNVLATYNF